MHESHNVLKLVSFFIVINAYVHNVSPVKTGRNSGVLYYDMTLQMEGGNSRAVCFRTKEQPRDGWEELATNKSPVKKNAEAPVQSISSVLQGKVQGLVSIIAYLELADRPTVLTSSKFHKKWLKRRRSRLMTRLAQ